MKGKAINPRLFLKQSSPTILTCISVIGVVGTVVLAIKATPKATELIKASSRKNHDGDPYASTKIEAVKSCWKCYIPTIITGTSTIACILGANVLNKRQQATLASAYALISNSYKEYRTKLKELYGEEAHSKIMESIELEKCREAKLYAPSFIANSYLIPENDSSEEKCLFYDLFSDRYFESTLGRVISAEYHLNRNFMFNGTIPLNEFYDFLGLDGIPEGDSIGWSSCDGDIYWIDFNHRKIDIDGGLECYLVEMIFEPDSSFLEDL